MKMECKDQAKVDALNAQDAAILEEIKELHRKIALKQGERTEIARQVRDQFAYPTTTT